MSETNTNNTNFIKASRLCIRWQTPKGQLSVEELWSLSEESLDKLLVALDDAIQKMGSKSFLTPKGRDTENTQLKFDIALHVLQTKQAEKEAAKTRAAVRAQRDTLLKLKENKSMSALEALTLEEIEARLASLPSDG